MTEREELWAFISLRRGAEIFVCDVLPLIEILHRVTRDFRLAPDNDLSDKAAPLGTEVKALFVTRLTTEELAQLVKDHVGRNGGAYEYVVEYWDTKRMGSPDRIEGTFIS